MISKKYEVQDELIIQTLEELVPLDHLVRKLAQIDYTFIYDIVDELYSKNGRPSIDPIILFKILTLKYVFQIKSIRQTMKELEVNLAYRWFVKIPLSQKLPHYTVISYNFNQRFNTDHIGEKILMRIFEQILDLNILSPHELDLSKTNLKIYQTPNHKVKIKLDETALYEMTLV